MSKIGFVGLGIMGKPMVLNLLKNRYAVYVYLRRRNAIQELSSPKVTEVSSPQELARACATIIIMVSDTPDVEEIILSSEGIINGVQPDAIVIDMSTISPDATRKLARVLAEKRAHMLDAPVSGGERGAIEATLSIMVGGKPEIYQKALPLLQCLGKNIVHVGDHGAGQVAKSCNQILVAQTMCAVAEAFKLALSNGVNPSKVREALLGGFAYSRILEVHGQRILNGDYKPGFKAKLHNKDLRIAMANARAHHLSLLGTEIVAEYMEQLVKKGMGELDSAAIAKLILEK